MTAALLTRREVTLERALAIPAPDAGRVALLASPGGPQGPADADSLQVHEIAAIARALAAGGARVRIVAVPGRLDDAAAFDAQVEVLRREGLDVVTDGESREVAVGGEIVRSAGVLAACLDVDLLAVATRARPHAHQRLAGPLLALLGALPPSARERLVRGAADPDDLRSALAEIAAALRPGLAIAHLGRRMDAWVRGADLLEVEHVVRRLHGEEKPEARPALTISGLDPALVVREAATAREALPPGPDRYPGVDADLCTRCGTCVDLCPTAAIALPGGKAGETPLEIDRNACLRCGVCVASCPDFALSASFRPEASKLRKPEGLVLDASPLDDSRAAAVPIEAALALGSAAVDPPARRPAWLEGFAAPDRFERARRRERHPEPKVERRVLPRDGAVRLLVPPNWGIRGNRTSLGIAYLGGSLDAAGIEFHTVDLAHELRDHEPFLHEDLEVVGNPDPNGGFYGPRMPLLLQVVDPDAFGAEAPPLARRVHEWAEAAAERVGDPGALHGLTVADSAVTAAFALGAAIRRRGGRVVFGGPTASHAETAELALRIGAADAVVQGEGEAAIVALAERHRDGTWRTGDDLSRAMVPGLVHLAGGEVRRVANFRNRELDALPFPDWRGQVLPGDFVPILAARGCVTKCSFCSEQTISPKFSQRSVEDVLTEMEHMAERTGCRRFEFNDDLLNGNLKWLEGFCDEMIARGRPFEWQGLCRPHRMTRELLERMRDAGCVQISYGVQHFSWRMLKVMGRKEEPDPLRQVLDDTMSLGIDCYMDVILGHPGETEEDVDITVDAVRDLMTRYPNAAINLNPFNYIYGSGVDLDPAAFGVTVERFSGSLPARFAAVEALARTFVTGFHQDPGPDAVVDRVNRLAWTVFQSRMPEKIPILDEELPFCNDNCLHCGVAEIMKTANVVPLHEVVRSLRELAPRSGGRVMFAVSELTIRPDFLRIVRAARESGMKTVALVTNGRMFAYEAFARKAVESGLTHALVSVYGATARVHQSITRTPGSFEQTIAGLRNLLAYPEVTVMTNSVITKKNFRYLPQMVELLAGLGVRNINLSFVQIIGAAEHYERAVVPRIREVLPYLKDAVDLGVELGRNMGIGGLPYCVLKGYEHHFGVDDLTYIANGDAGDTITERSPYTKAEACRRCAMNAVCLGMQETYLARHGEDELDPYHGRRVERRPDSEIVRAMFPDLQYTRSGQPSSLFAAAGLASALPSAGAAARAPE